jgi:hypothetical protein
MPVPGPGPGPEPVPIVDPDEVALTFEGTELSVRMTAVEKSIADALAKAPNSGKKVRITWRLE